MKSKPPASRPSPILMLAPLALVLLAYNYFFNIPQQQNLSVRRAALTKLENNADEIRHAQGHVMGDLAAVRRQEKELNEQLIQAKAAENELIALRKDRLDHLFRPRQPAATMSQAIALLERHRLVCLDNRSTSSSQGGKGSATHEALKPIAELLGGTPKEASSRVEYRIKLSGRYADLRHALHELLETRPDVLPLAIEMDAPEDLRTDQRTWILTLLV